MSVSVRYSISYVKEYMNKYFRAVNGTNIKRGRLNRLMQTQYEINDFTKNTFSTNLRTIVRIKELLDTLDDVVMNTILLNKTRLK